ncbi:hypothetical protein [Sphingobacterium sp. UDSM-2020]|uniref:hypothetical protein n=1 Tax=Sphingobacterium TaxID=28453 RepID=UPI00193873B3|nr:hypothetical protein [Sphingobacterium sp. UDSM-2020]QQD13169.1 hypothetical protein JAZ75_21645 [Sphingobacterium sp. UDSM-2020]
MIEITILEILKRNITKYNLLKAMKKMTDRSTLIVLLLLTILSTNVFGQNQIKFKKEGINENIKTLFKNNEEIDSIMIEFENSIPLRLEIYKQSDSITKYQTDKPKPFIIKHGTFYNLNFDGDMFFLKKELNLLYQIISNKNLIKKISNIGKEKNFRIVITHDALYKRKFVGNDTFFAVLKPKRKNEFIELLNNNYTDSLKFGGDSIVIFQAIVYKGGHLGETAILHGEKKLLDYFFSNYKPFTKKAHMFPRESLFQPFLAGGRPLVSLIDVYLKINADKTFILSATGEGRDLKIKNYKDDESYGNLFF